MGDIYPIKYFTEKKHDNTTFRDNCYFFFLEGNLSFIKVCLHCIDKNPDLNEDFEILSLSMSERPTPIDLT